ncbi:MAG TPA: hypothetical protein VLQ79_09135, partial [Myxococcaceae bacterium]|nr:hypothetical protein [Myxococcaceae bacterium]
MWGRGRHRSDGRGRRRHCLAAPRPGPLTTALKAVPVLEQYQRIKADHPDAILLFRLGDFYETFGADAECAAPILGITLTSRELGKGQRMPMAGIPYHAMEAYVGKLLRAGLRVALCDQVEEAGPGRGLVRREVTRILTPGTVLEEAYLEGTGSNYVLAICLRSHHHGLAALDCSTGELSLIRTDPTEAAIRDELSRLRPAELIAAEADRSSLSPLIGSTPVTWVEDRDFDPRAAGERLRALLGVETLAAFGCEEWPEALAAGHAVLAYAERTHLRLEPGMVRLRAEHPHAFMHLDPATRSSLGLEAGRRLAPEESLLGLLQLESVTPMGARTLQRWVSQPLRARDRLESRLERVEQLSAEALRRGELRSALQSLPDLERIVARVGQSLAHPRELRLLSQALAILPRVQRITSAWEDLAIPPLPSAVPELQRELEAALVDEVPASVREGGVFRAGFDGGLDAIRDGAREAREWIA